VLNAASLNVQYPSKNAAENCSKAICRELPFYCLRSVHCIYV